MSFLYPMIQTILNISIDNSLSSIDVIGIESPPCAERCEAVGQRGEVKATSAQLLGIDIHG